MKLFDVQNNAGNDQCAIAARDVANTGVFSYTFNSHPTTDRGKLLDFSSRHSNLRFRDGYVPQQTIDESSGLRLLHEWHTRGRQQLSTRVYHAAPDLSRGDVKDDSAVRTGEVTFDRADALSGVSIDRFQPLIPGKQREVQDPRTIMSDGVRGGQNTRDLTRTVAYVAADGYRRETPASPWVAR
jgi:hypothetical protein